MDYSISSPKWGLFLGSKAPPAGAVAGLLRGPGGWGLRRVCGGVGAGQEGVEGAQAQGLPCPGQHPHAHRHVPTACRVQC